MSSMVGTGIFTTTGLMLAAVSSGWLIIFCWLLGGIVALCGALSYAELAAAMPKAGAEYVYLKTLYGPLAGFLSGWTSFLVGFSASIAASAVACGEYLAAGGLLPARGPALKVTALAITFALTLIHYAGLRIGSRVQNLLTGLNLFLLFGLVIAGFALGRGSFEFLEPASPFWMGGRASQLGIALLWVMFAYSGWNASAYMAEEVRDPARTLPRSLLTGTLIVVVLYLLLNLLLFYAAPQRELTGVVSVAKVGAEKVFGGKAASYLAVLIGLVLLSSLSAYILTGPRVYYSMARDGLFFRFAARVHPRLRIPDLSILVQGLWACVIILTGSFEALLTYAGFALGIFPCMAVAGLFILRRRISPSQRPYSVPGYPLVPAFYLAAMVLILIVALVNRPGPSLLALASVGAGIPIYLLLRRWKPRAQDARL